MRKSYAEMQGKRLFNLHTGIFGRVAKVIPHGKTSARFVVKYEDSKCGCEWEDTWGELTKHNAFVGEEYKHVLPAPAERLRRIVETVDGKADGAVRVIHGHSTELDSWVKDEANGRTVRDGFSVWRERTEAKFVMGIGIWGSGLDLSLECGYREADAAGGNLWKVFKPKIEEMIADMEEVKS